MEDPVVEDLKCQTEEYRIWFSSQKRVSERCWDGEWKDQTSALGKVMWRQCLECTWWGWGGEKRQGKQQLLWDSKCLYCSENGKGWISKNEFVKKCNNWVDVLSLSPFLSPPPSLKFRIILPVWGQHNDFIWESTLPPCSVQVTHVKLNSLSPLPE